MLKSDWTRDNCAVGNTLAVIGERWTLLVLREAFLGVRRFDQLQRNTGMARNILSDRLNTLVAHESPGASSSTRSGRSAMSTASPTKGLDLYPVLLTLMDWGATHARRRGDDAAAQELRRRRDAAPRLPRVRRARRGAGHASRPRRGAAEDRLARLLLAPRSRKNDAKTPAMPETRMRAVTSSTMSTIRPPVVSGFGICDETVSSCTVVKKNASQRLWIALRTHVVLEQPHQERSHRVDDRRRARVPRAAGGEGRCADAAATGGAAASSDAVSPRVEDGDADRTTLPGSTARLRSPACRAGSRRLSAGRPPHAPPP